MQVNIDNKVQQGESYSNVSIDHTNGFMAISDDNLIRITSNGTNCFSVWSGDGSGDADSWTLVSQLDANGLQAYKLTTIGSNTYALIGTNSSGNPGLFIFTGTTRYCQIWPDINGHLHIDNATTGKSLTLQGDTDVYITCGSGKAVYFKDANGNLLNESKNVPYGTGSMYFYNGMLSSFTDTTKYTGTTTISGVNINIANGLITSVT